MPLPEDQTPRRELNQKNLKIRLFYIWIGCCLWSFSTLKAQVDTLSTQEEGTENAADVGADTIRISSDIETTIQYTAEDSIITDVVENKVYLYGKAKVNYGDISLTAAEIVIDQNNNVVNARGVPDSTGRLQDTPIFSQTGESYEADSMRYNFKTEKGVISGIVTQQGEGYIQSRKAKKDSTGIMYAAGNRYTTCNLKHPHWYIYADKIKLIPEKQVITGPFNLVIADVPTPLGFAFGIFPFTDRRRSGIIVPSYGESRDRGFFLRQGGYYWAINDYMAATFLGEIYTNGTWGIDTRFNYRKRYRYSGNASIRYFNRIQGDEGEETVFQDFNFRWSHTPVTRGRSSFSASVNLGSTQNNRRNSFDPQEQITNTFNSSVTYNTSFDAWNTPVTLGLSGRQSQNSRTGVVDVTLPAMNLGVNRIYPFKKQGQSAKNFLQNINLSYNFSGEAVFTNVPPNTNAFPFEVANDPQEDRSFSEDNQAPPFFSDIPELLKNAQIGGIHNIPISTTIKLLRYFSLNPSFNYQEAWYPKKLNYTWIDSLNAVQVDTLNQFSRVYSYSTSASLTTRIFGTFLFDKKNKGKRLQAVRHTVVPNISFSYRPDLSDERIGFFQRVQVDSTGENFRDVSRYLGFRPGPPLSTSEAGVISFSLQNIFEAKVLPRGDTAKPKKISLLDNLSFSGSYNLVADSLNLSNISIAARTRLLNTVDFNFTGTLDPYVYRILSVNEDGTVRQQTRVNKFAWEEGRGIGQLSRFNISLSANFTPDAFRKKTQRKAKDKIAGDDNINESQEQELEFIQNNPEEYVDFDIPWSLRATYNINYSRVGFQESRVEQQINFSGDVSLTSTWKITFRSGYDISRSQISFTNIGIVKDLHCWEMNFNWNPIGTFQSYIFNIRVKSSILQDLKVTRQRSFYDRDF